MFIWSYGWWLEKERAWFVDGMTNTLFCVDLNTEECEKVVGIPNVEKHIYCQNPYCAKLDRDIYCIPGQGKSIWIYNLDQKDFTELEIDEPKNHAPGSQFWIWGGRMFVVIANWNKLIEISVKERRITNYYTICASDSVRRSVLVDNKIYAISYKTGAIYQFDLVRNEVKTYLHPDMGKKFFSICYDGEKFWLCGYKREVYVWNKENDILITINFPKDFEIYDVGSKMKEPEKESKAPLFGQTVAMGKYIWFIPTVAEKIIYIDKETSVLSVFNIYEDDKAFSQKCPNIANYLLQYIRDDRYIGLFSARNSRIIEIDTMQLEYQWKGYYFNEQYLQQYCETCKGIYDEGKDLQYIYTYHMSRLATGCKVNIADTVGRKIYTKLIEESTK